MSKNKIIAEKTLKIISEGYYTFSGKNITIKEQTDSSVKGSFTVAPEDWSNLTKQTQRKANKNFTTEIEVKNLSTIQALQQAKEATKIGILNFASAKNPGGGFMGGASAQEESLARSSSLYASLTKDTAMYKFNKAHSTFLYSDYMIFSPDVLFWMDDDGTVLENPLTADVITSPAPNKGAMLQHKRDSEIKNIENVFLERIEKVLQLALSQNIDYLILGAWGCGVFRNDPNDVALYFKKVIHEKFHNKFKKIVFAIYDRSEEQKVLNAFKDQF